MIARFAAALAIFAAWCPIAHAQTSPVPVPAIEPAPTRPDYYAPFVKATQPLEFCHCALLAEFIVTSDSGLLRLRRENGYVLQVVELNEPLLVLRVLADQRMAALWPAILDWAGPGLEKIADAAALRARAAWRLGYEVEPKNTAESSVRAPTRALLQYSNTLLASGRRDEAAALLRGTLAEPLRRGNWAAAERAMLRLRLANLLSNSGDTENALAELARGEAEAKGTAYAINFMVNRAAFLAEAGRYAESLTAVERGSAAFHGKISGGGERIEGSDRFFDWIRACALKGLGRTAEAEALAARVRAAPPPVGDGFVVQSNLGVNFRADRCLGDHEGLVRDMLEAMDGPALASSAWLVMQPAYRDERRDAPLLEAMRRDPRVIAALAGRMRVLPPELVPALKQWRDSQRPPLPLQPVMPPPRP